MLKLKYLFENFELAKECLKLYDFDEKSVDKMLSYYRISSNAVYPFRSMTTGEVCFLRLSPVEEKSEAEVVSEIELIEWLIGQGFPAMRPYPMKDGRTHTVLKTEWGTYNVSCFEGVGGEMLEYCDDSLELAKGYGRTLGELHADLKRFPHPEIRRDHLALMAEIRERFRAYGAPAKLTEEWENVNGELKKLAADADTYGVIHYDFEADNVLYCDKTDIYGVIDFDDSMRCWYALDVARAMDSLDDVAGEENSDEAKDAFLSGYREAAPFTDEQLSSIPLMRRLVCLQEYGTILYVLSEPAENEPDWMTEIKEKLNFRLRQIENGI